MLSASNMPTPDHSTDYSTPTTILLLPAFVVISKVTPGSIPQLIKDFIDPAPSNRTPLGPLSVPASLSDPPQSEHRLESRPSGHRALILLCSQKTRDARCGQSAPLLRKEFERHLRPLGLYRGLDDDRPGGVGIYFISHVGGHKYSANVMIYRRPNPFNIDHLERASADVDLDSIASTAQVAPDEDHEGAAQCIWLARVRPEDCQNIVKFTVLQGKVVKPERQLRGGFDRQKGLFSW